MPLVSANRGFEVRRVSAQKTERCKDGEYHKQTECSQILKRRADVNPSIVDRHYDCRGPGSRDQMRQVLQDDRRFDTTPACSFEERHKKRLARLLQPRMGRRIGEQIVIAHPVSKAHSLREDRSRVSDFASGIGHSLGESSVNIADEDQRQSADQKAEHRAYGAAARSANRQSPPSIRRPPLNRTRA